MDDTRTTRTRPRRPLSRSLCPPHTTSRARAPRDRAPSRRRCAAARRSSRRSRAVCAAQPRHRRARPDTSHVPRKQSAERHTLGARRHTRARRAARPRPHTRAPLHEAVRRCTRSTRRSTIELRSWARAARGSRTTLRASERPWGCRTGLAAQRAARAEPRARQVEGGQPARISDKISKTVS